MKPEATRLETVRARIGTACRDTGREVTGVRLLAVSKTQPADALRRLHGCGQKAFGENRVQEALPKQGALADLDIEWHFIGPVQSNKTRELAEHFDWVQSVDREKILRRLADQRAADLPPLNVCLQVNIDREPQKAGLPPESVAQLARLAAGMPRIRLRGLMAIPELNPDPDQVRDSFRRMRALFDSLCAAGVDMDTLSMGMSGDLELAIAEGSTMVRVGTDLFGPRNP